MNRRLAVLAVAGLLGAGAFAGPGLAGSGNGDGNDPGDAYKNKFDDITASRACNDEVDTVGYAGPELVWPPNHKLAPASVISATADVGEDEDGNATYDNGETVGLETTATSDEPANGTGDGNTAEDTNQAADAEPPAADGKASTDHQVRAERAGTGDGRVYEIDFVAEFQDADGEPYVCTSNGWELAPEDRPTEYEGKPVEYQAPFLVTVPHDMSDPAVRAKRNIGN